MDDDQRVARDRVQRLLRGHPRAPGVCQRPRGRSQSGVDFRRSASSMPARERRGCRISQGRKRFMMLRWRCDLPAGKTDEVIGKLNEQSGGNDDAGDIRRDEARVMHDFENRGRVVFFKTGLVIGIAAIPQRVIHVDQHVAVFGAFRVDELDVAGEVFGDVGAGVTLVRELLERRCCTACNNASGATRAARFFPRNKMSAAPPSASDTSQVPSDPR